MSRLTRPLDPTHRRIRTGLRIGGPALLLTGVFMAGFGAFTLIVGDPFAHPVRMFVCMFIGMPVIFVGGVASMFGWATAGARYAARETVPLATDAARALRPRRAPTFPEQGPATCAVCDAPRLPETGFCSQCGAAFFGTPCRACRHLNGPDANFCAGCGSTVNQGAG